MKRSRVLAEAESEAEIPYEETRLARRAARARPRLGVLLTVGAMGLALEAALQGSAGWLLGAVAVGLTAWGVWKGRLGGVIAAALVALLAALLPIRFYFVGARELDDIALLAFVTLWGLAMLPDVLTLVRDAELQYAYGRWARRERA